LALWDDAAMTISGGRSDPQTGRTGLALRDPLPWAQLCQVVETAEDTGYEAVFVPEIAGREAFGTLAAFAQVISRMRLGTGVVSVRSRSPVTTAMAAATIQDLSHGRLVLGLGSGSPTGPPEATRPLELVGRYVRLVRAILSGEAGAGDDGAAGPEFHLDLAPQVPVPIWVAALGDGMVRLGGELADGVLLNWCTPERVAAARILVTEAAERAGRDPAAVTLAVYVRTCLGLEEAAATEALKEMTGRYAAIPHYRRQFEAMGLGKEAALGAKAFQAGRSDQVPERLVQAVTVSGGRRDALRRFAAYRDAGADLVICYPVIALDPFSSVLGSVLGAAPSPSLGA
jgi:alkanesulfonate monooxygenase SsuD/methylene tetrahydromethanopterin reductase-like flavin-dependent oxidoreductase (luciferase family)